MKSMTETLRYLRSVATMWAAVGSLGRGLLLCKKNWIYRWRGEYFLILGVSWNRSLQRDARWVCDITGNMWITWATREQDVTSDMRICEPANFSNSTSFQSPLGHRCVSPPGMANWGPWCDTHCSRQADTSLVKPQTKYFHINLLCSGKSSWDGSCALWFIQTGHQGVCCRFP